MHEYFSFASEADGLTIDCLHAYPEGEVKATVLMAHGIMEYKERYLDLMRALNQAGFACAINDHRGYGKSVKSPDDKGYTYEQGANGTLIDMRTLALWLKNKYAGKPMYVYGHSMGALCGACYIKKYAGEVAGAVLSGLPAPNSAAGAGKKYMKLKRMLKGARYRDQSVNKLMFDSFCAKFKGEPSPFNWMNSDPQKVAEYESDENCGFLCTVDGYISLIDLMLDAYDASGWTSAGRLIGITLLAGADDPCAGGEVGARKQVEYFKRIGFANTTSRLYPGMRHEIHNEPDRGKVISDIIQAFGG